MKTIILAAAILALPFTAQAGYGIDAQRRALECTGKTISQASRGNFSNWVLPEFIGGTHLRAGQYLDENCTVRGAPAG